MKRLGLCGLVAAVLLLLGDARGFVRSRTDKGTAVFWPQSAAWIVADTDPGFDLTLDAVTTTLAKSVQSWQAVTFDTGCSYLKINVDPAAVGEAHLDHINVLKFRTDKWCRPAEKGTAEMCYSPQAAAITTIFYTSKAGDPRDGEIVDADIEFNNINFTFVTYPSDVPPRTGTMKTDFENTLTHELGHFQGLDHTCWDHVSANQPLDDQGTAVPDCTEVIAHNVPPDVYQKIVFATMFNFAGSVETYKRTPEADDSAGICSIYAKAKDPMNYNRPQPIRGGCSVGLGGLRGSSGAGPLSSLALLGALLVLVRLRARACSRSRRR